MDNGKVVKFTDYLSRKHCDFYEMAMQHCEVKLIVKIQSIKVVHEFSNGGEEHCGLDLEMDIYSYDIQAIAYSYFDYFPITLTGIETSKEGDKKLMNNIHEGGIYRVNGGLSMMGYECPLDLVNANFELLKEEYEWSGKYLIAMAEKRMEELFVKEATHPVRMLNDQLLALLHAEGFRDKLRLLLTISEPDLLIMTPIEAYSTIAADNDKALLRARSLLDLKLPTEYILIDVLRHYIEHDKRALPVRKRLEPVFTAIQKELLS